MEAIAARLVAAIVVHYGDPRRTIRAVRSHWELGVFSDIVIVSNDLTGRPPELEDIPCTWLVPSRNLGFGGACQLGAKTCSADVYAFFNVHTTIDRVSVDYCRSAFDVQDVGIVAPCVYQPSRKNSATNWRYARCTRRYSRVLRLPVQVPAKTGWADSYVSRADLIDNEWATGAAIFCRKEVVRDVRWDDSYFLGYEDVDISMRAKMCGWRVVSVPSAVALHAGGSTRTLAAASYYCMRNAVLFARRYRSRRIQAMLTAYLLTLLCRVAAADVLKRRRPPHLIPAARGMADGWLSRPSSAEGLPGRPVLSGGDSASVISGDQTGHAPMCPEARRSRG